MIKTYILARYIALFCTIYLALGWHDDARFNNYHKRLFIKQNRGYIVFLLVAAAIEVVASF